LFVGVKDDGTPSELDISDRLLQTLADIKTDGKIVPPPTITVEKRRLLGAPAAAVTVWPADAPPVRYDGRIWIRIGSRRAIATPQDERVLSEKRRANDQPFDLIPETYWTSVLERPNPPSDPFSDPNFLAQMKHYRSLMPLGQDVHKPIFRLTAADGAIGAHARAVANARHDFSELAKMLLERMRMAPAISGAGV
jgi:hypothetical protein